MWEPGSCSEPRTEASPVQLCPERSAGEGQQAPVAHIASLFSRWLVWDGPSSSVTLLGKREPKDMRIRAGYTAKGAVCSPTGVWQPRWEAGGTPYDHLLWWTLMTDGRRETGSGRPALLDRASKSFVL